MKVEVYPGIAGPNANQCPGINIKLESEQGAVVASAANVELGSVQAFSLLPGGYKVVADYTPQSTWNDSAPFAIIAEQQVAVTLERQSGSPQG